MQWLSPPISASVNGRDLAEKLDAPLAIIEKRRLGNQDTTETLNIIGDVKGRRAITVDDEIDTAGSLVNAVDALLKAGAKEVYSCSPIRFSPAWPLSASPSLP